MKGAVLAVDRCVCHGVTFRELKGLSERVGGGFAELSERTGCGTGCGLCRPYIEAMLRTGRTEFGVGEGTSGGADTRDAGEAGDDRRRVRRVEQFRGEGFVFEVEVDAWVDDDGPDGVSFDPQTVDRLAVLERLVREGRIEELKREGAVYLRKAG